MAALVVITLVSVFSRLAASVYGSVITLASAILLLPSLGWFGLGFLLGRLWHLSRFRARRGTRLRQQSVHGVQLGVQVVQLHLNVGHALGNRNKIGPAGHGQMLERFKHRFLNCFAKWSGDGEVAVKHRAAGLRIGLGVDHIYHGLGPGVHVDVAHPAPRLHGIEALAVLGWFVTHLPPLSA